jgi:hypothetical protein
VRFCVHLLRDLNNKFGENWSQRNFWKKKATRVMSTEECNYEIIIETE